MMRTKILTNGVAELAGKCLWLAATILFITACNSETQSESSTDTADPAQLISHIKDQCGSTLPSAAYNLFDKESLFHDPSLYAGQPSGYFSELMGSRGVSQFNRQFEKQFQMLESSEQEKLARNLSRWCNLYSKFKDAETGLSSEELLSILSHNEPFRTIFRNTLNERYPVIDADISVDQAGRLSSAQFYAFKQELLSILADEHEEVFSEADAVLTKLLNH